MFRSTPLDTRFFQLGVSRPQTTARHQNQPPKPAKEVAMVWLKAKAHQLCPSWGFWARFFQMLCVWGFWGVRWTTFSSWIAEAGNQLEEPLVWLPKCAWLSECICCLKLWRSCGFRSNITMVSTSMQFRFLASWTRYCKNCPFPRLSNHSLKLSWPSKGGRLGNCNTPSWK